MIHINRYLLDDRSTENLLLWSKGGAYSQGVNCINGTLYNMYDVI